MSASLVALLAAADAKVAGPDFNAESFARREDALARFGQTAAYETVVGPEITVDALAADLIPKLQDHLRSKGMAPGGGPGLLVWIWFGEHAYLFSGRAIFERLDGAGRLLLPG